MVDTTARGIALPEPMRPARVPRIAAAVTAVAPMELGRFALEALVGGAPSLALMGGRALEALDVAIAGASDVVLIGAHRGAGAAVLAIAESAIGLGKPTAVLVDGDPYLARRAAEIGAAALPWDASRAVMVERIVRIAGGHGAAVAAACTRSSVHLSRQEQRVMRHYARGASLKAVAAELGLNIHLVEEYVRRARAKYAAVGRPAATKVELYMRAVEDGLLPAPA